MISSASPPAPAAGTAIGPLATRPTQFVTFS